MSIHTDKLTTTPKRNPTTDAVHAILFVAGMFVVVLILVWLVGLYTQVLTPTVVQPVSSTYNIPHAPRIDEWTNTNAAVVVRPSLPNSETMLQARSMMDESSANAVAIVRSSLPNMEAAMQARSAGVR
jgi:hypothetical protein